MKIHKLLPVALLILGIGQSTAEDNFNLKGNIQTQGSKSFSDDDNNLSSFWFRANIGGQYKSDNLDGQIMIRLFGSEFGNTIENKKYDKILADVYFANYKWNTDLGKLNLKLGHWKNNWSESSFFGTYLDKNLTSRGLESRDQAVNGIELGYALGISKLNIMLGTTDNKWNTGYVRIEETLDFDLPLTLKLAYRGNLLDRIQNTSYTTHRMAFKGEYEFFKKFRAYGEIAYLYTQKDDDVNENAENYVNTQDSYLNPGKSYLPIYLGLEIPTPIFDQFFAEAEFIKDRDQLSSKESDADNLAWTLAFVKKIKNTKIQFGVYSEEKINNVGLATRISTSFN